VLDAVTADLPVQIELPDLLVRNLVGGVVVGTVGTYLARPLDGEHGATRRCRDEAVGEDDDGWREELDLCFQQAL